jgi:hypothetical protein
LGGVRAIPLQYISGYQEPTERRARNACCGGSFTDDLGREKSGLGAILAREEDVLLNSTEETRAPVLFNVVALLVSLTAGVAAFLPFAVNTSAWDAVTLRVPGDQGNWWHLLVGAPFFFAFPMIWLRLRSLCSKHLSTPVERRLIWVAVAMSIGGTILVEAPVLLRLGNLSHMRTGRWLSMTFPAFGVMIACAALLILRRNQISPTRACFVGLNAAYLANAAICLVLYAPMRNSGWFVIIGVALFTTLELVGIFIQSLRV